MKKPVKHTAEVSAGRARLRFLAIVSWLACLFTLSTYLYLPGYQVPNDAGDDGRIAQVENVLQRGALLSKGAALEQEEKSSTNIDRAREKAIGNVLYAPALTNDEYRQRLAHVCKQELIVQYAEILSLLKLSPETSAEVVNVLLNRRLESYDAQSAAQGNQRIQMMVTHAIWDEAYLDLKSILGDENAALLRVYEKMPTRLRDHLKEIELRCASSGVGLSSEQRDKLLNYVLEKILASDVDVGIMSTSREISDRFLESVSSMFSPNQLEEIYALKQDQHIVSGRAVTPFGR